MDTTDLLVEKIRLFDRTPLGKATAAWARAYDRKRQTQAAAERAERRERQQWQALKDAEGQDAHGYALRREIEAEQARRADQPF